MKIAITGISGRLGRILARRLHRQHAVVGIDRRKWGGIPADVTLHRIDIRRKRCEDIFRSGDFDAVVHLNVMHNPRASTEEHHTFNIKGTSRVMTFCARYGIPKLVILSSANVYGPRPDNQQFLTEAEPLMAASSFSAISDLVAVDMCAQGFFWQNPEVHTVILRPVHILGGVRNAPSNYLRLERPIRLAGFDPMVQVIHEEDVVTAIERALTPKVRGVFNVAGCEPVPLSRLIELAGGRPLLMPHTAARAMLERMWSLRLTSFPAPELDHLRYVCMVDDSRARDQLGHVPEWSLEETLADLRLTRTLHRPPRRILWPQG
ncbi:MAG: SDR family oxidoreductase [Bradymonadia bacterium]